MICPFCDDGIDAYGEVIFSTSLAYVLTNPDPVLKASVMIMPKRHVESPFDLSEEEWLQIRKLMQKAKSYLEQFAPQGFNMGWNVGEVAGQHVPHVHFHVIGRYADEPLAGKGIRYFLKQKENKRP